MNTKYFLIPVLLLLGSLSGIPILAQGQDSDWKKGLQSFEEMYPKAKNVADRATAIRKLGEANHPGVVKTILETVIPKEIKENDPLLLNTVALTLGGLTDKSAVKELVAAARRTQPPDKIILINALSKINTPEAQSVLIELIRQTEPLVQIAAIDALAEANPPEALDKVIDALNSKSWEVRAGAINYLSRVKDDESKQKAAEALRKRRAKEEGRLVTDISLVLNKFSKAPTPTAEENKDPGLTIAFFNIPINSDVIFVLDISSSMSTGKIKEGLTRIEALRRELTKTLEQMAKSKKPLKLNIVAYSSFAQRWQKDFVPVSENKDKVLKWLDELQLGIGTNLYDSLELALTGGGTPTGFSIGQTSPSGNQPGAPKVFATSGKPEPFTICFMSDGAPTGGRYRAREEILTAVRMFNQSRKIKINTVALGVGTEEKMDIMITDLELMKKLAEENDGLYKEF